MGAWQLDMVAASVATATGFIFLSEASGKDNLNVLVKNFPKNPWCRETRSIVQTCVRWYKQIKHCSM